HAEDSIRARNVTGVQTCALPIYGPDRFRAPPCEAIKHYLHRIARQPPQHCAEGKHNQHESQTLTCPRKILNPKNIFQPSPAVLGGGLAGDTPRVKCLWESFLFLRELFLRRERISQSVCVELLVVCKFCLACCSVWI